ncbi:MAG: type II toxin-antitoxin system VapC family toxin [Cyclobacteriaceae bacterium]|nr:type II toxin-antitoxin system VapC family toxin [Cyclobacteriaceae bacterium]
MAKKEIVLCDTNILIELSKNNKDISVELKNIGYANIAVSSVTAGEFIFGALDKMELVKIKKALNSIQIIHVTEDVSERVLELLGNYSLSHNLTVPDALIAATALTHEVKLYTLNVKDFNFIDGIELYGSKS